jgi:hypothetical protein
LEEHAERGDLWNERKIADPAKDISFAYSEQEQVQQYLRIM